jgi:hypothetical protein
MWWMKTAASAADSVPALVPAASGTWLKTNRLSEEIKKKGG